MEHIQQFEQRQSGNAFIGRHLEMETFRSWLYRKDAPTHIFSITGIGGIGKSTFLSQLAHMAAAAEDIAIIRLDASLCQPTPTDFLQYLRSALELELLGNRQPLDVLFHANHNSRVLLCIDNFEQIAKLEQWLLDTFLAKLPSAGVGVLLASRKPLEAQASIAHTHFALQNFSYIETIAYIGATGAFTQQQISELAKVTDGHPMGLALSVEAALKHNGKSEDDDARIICQTISAKVLKEITTPELLPLVDVLIVMRYANQETLSAVLDRPVSLQEYQKLQQYSFIQLHPQGIALHEIAQSYLLRDLKLREPNRLQELHKKCITVLYQQLRNSVKKDKQVFASRMLQLSKEALPLHNAYAKIIPDASDLKAGHMNPADLPALHHLLDAWCQYSVTKDMYCTYHQFLDEVAIDFPESIVTLRNAYDIPIAMFITVLVTTETVPLLQRYFPNELEACFTAQDLRVPYDKADSYFAVLAAASEHAEPYTREELVGMLVLDQLSLLGRGMRAALVAANADLKQFLTTIGFYCRPLATAACDVPWGKAEVLELDLREKPFGEWVLDMADPAEKLTLTDDIVKKLMEHLKQPEELNCYKDYFEQLRNGHEIQHYILTLLQHETELLTVEQQKLLYTAYYLFPKNTVKAAQACSMSRATYYRHLPKAIKQLTKLLH